MTGWCGKILRIDLDSSATDILRPDPVRYEKFIGGKGLAGSFLRDRITLAWDDPAAPLLIMTGPLVGTAAPTSGRTTIMSRSPLTGTVTDCSVGGRLGFHLKRAGWDGVLITGRAANPCGIVIDNETIKLVDAVELWGADTATVFQRLQKRDNSVATIGPAAENGVSYASLMVDRHHAAGRGGIGRCFGAKNIKYLVVRGSGRVSVHDKAELTAAREEILRLAAASPVLMGEHGIARFGTGALYDLMDARRMMPTDNFRRTRFAAAPGLGAVAYAKRFQPKQHGCMGCHIRCKKVTGHKNRTAMPEFETMSHFTALIGNTDPDLVVRANDLCNRLGMDTISAAATLACYRELEGEIDLAPSLLALLEQIGTGSTRLGRELGEGARAFARKQGRPELSMDVKGQELPAYDPRGAYGMSLAYATSTRGGCHLRAYPISHEILRKPVATDRFTFSGKARIIKISEDLNAVVDSLTACKFIFFAAGPEEYARAFSAVTGMTITAQDLLEAGERIYYQERLMNAANGFDDRDDDLPARFFKEPGSGSAPGTPPVDRAAFLEARRKYYRIRGLDAQGRPTPEKTRQLGLA